MIAFLQSDTDILHMEMKLCRRVWIYNAPHGMRSLSGSPLQKCFP